MENPKTVEVPRGTLEKLKPAALKTAAWDKALQLDSTRDNIFYTKAERIRDILWRIKRNLIYRFFRFFRLVPDIDKIARECVEVLALDVLDGYPGETVDGKDYLDIPESIFLKFEDKKVGEGHSISIPLKKELKGEGGVGESPAEGFTVYFNEIKRPVKKYRRS